MVALLTQLKVFQSIGHFLPLAQIPATALSYIAKQLSLAAPTDVSIDPRTTYRQNGAIQGCLPKPAKSNGFLWITFSLDASQGGSIFSGALPVRVFHARISIDVFWQQ
jgi:hypothetical protein